jgi:hypothetical protein
VTSPTATPAATSHEVAARLVAALDKLPTRPKSRTAIAAALAPTVTALIAEADAARAASTTTLETTR